MRILEGHLGGVRALAYHPDGGLLASGGEDGEVVLWRMPQGKRHSSRKQHTDWVRAIAFSPAGNRLASVGWDDRVFFGKVNESNHVAVSLGPHGGAWCVAFSPHATEFAVGSGDGTVSLLTADEQSLRQSPDYHGPRGHCHERPVVAVVFHAGGRRLLTASHDGTITTVNAALA